MISFKVNYLLVFVGVTLAITSAFVVSIILFYFPYDLAKFSSEPEDLYLSIFTLMLALIVLWVVVSTLMNFFGKSFFYLNTILRLRISTLILSVLLFAFTFIGLFSDDFSIKELRYLAVPAFYFAVCFIVTKGKDKNKDTRVQI